MKKLHLFLIAGLLSLGIAEAQQVKVLTLGTFHFAFPNLDVKKIEANKQIDVLAPKYQTEIQEIVNRLAAFKPTHIAIEVDPSKQQKIDSLYGEYLKGNYELTRNEHEQIGFRLAKQSGLKKLYCTNDWGRLYESINDVMIGKDSIVQEEFMNYFYNHPDTMKMNFREHVYSDKGILEDLRESNSSEHNNRDLGNYLIGVFKYESDDNSFFGADFTSGWWFNRNLRIFRNIQKIKAMPGDRILVIYGSGHMNLLNLFFDASPEYELVNALDYLK